MARWSEFLEEAVFTTRVVRMYDCDPEDAMLPVLWGDVI
jgi:hypothetical protein